MMLYRATLKQTSFIILLQEVSDYLIQGQVFQKMQPILDSNQENVAPNWREAISEKSELVGTIIHEMKNKKQKDGVCDLIRNIRNLVNIHCMDIQAGMSSSNFISGYAFVPDLVAGYHVCMILPTQNIKRPMRITPMVT